MTETNSPPSRTKGRPPSIDRLAALDAAVLTFWEKGYEGASLTDLTNAMNVSRPSLYSGFGDKAKLFDAALMRYAQTIGSAPMAAFEIEPNIAKAVLAFLSVSVQGNTMVGHPHGCLIGCCAATAAEVDSAVRERLRQLLSGTQSRLVERFEAETGLSTHQSSNERAGMMLDFMNGQAIRARAGATQADLNEGLGARVHAVLGSPY
jgi:AcrR family transcriptional regulator